MNAERQKRLDEIAKERQALRDQRFEVDNRLLEISILEKQIMIADFIETSGLQIGDKVQFKDGKDIKTGVIKVFKRHSYRACIIPVVAIHKKDGSVGLRTHDYWDGNLPTKMV